MGKHETRYAQNRARSLPHAPVSWSLLSPSTSISEICSCGSAPAGDGRMSEALKVAGCARVYSTDIAECGYAGQDEIFVFLAGLELKLPSRFPGWDHHESSIRQAGQARRGTHRSRASALSRRPCPLVGAAASEHFDSARTRRRFFGDCPDFVGKSRSRDA